MNDNFKKFLLTLQNHSDGFNNFLSNTFTMREIGNKTHGDLAEIALVEFINTYLKDNYSAIHVGKQLFRSKIQEEDIVVFDNTNNEEIPISIKAYGTGYLQLSTDKEYTLFPYLESFNSIVIQDKTIIEEILNNPIFSSIFKINVLPLIYNENDNTCNILVFDFNNTKKQVNKIEKILPSGRRKYPIYKFLDNDDNYLFEVRYGGKDANALQRGLWTNTKYAEKNFISISNGWIPYETRKNLLELLSHLMILDNNQINKLLKEKINE